MSSVAFLGPQNASKSLAAVATPHTPLGNLQRFTRPLAGFKGPTSKAPTSKGSREEGKGSEERGAKMIYAPGARNAGAATVANVFI